MFEKFLYSLLEDMPPATQDAILWSLALLALPFVLYRLLIDPTLFHIFLTGVLHLFHMKGNAMELDSTTTGVLTLITILVFIIVVMFVPALIITLIKRSIVNKPVAPDTFGSAHFATEQEAQAILPSPQQLATGEPYLFLGSAYGRTAALSPKQQESHVVLVAPTGQGKTSGIIIPGLLAETGKRSLFINDTKFELVGQCFGWLAQNHQCFILSPTKPENSHHYNPLAHVRDMEDAEDLAAVIVANTGEAKEAFWNNAAKLILTAAILHIKATNPNAAFYELVQMLTTLKLQDLQKLLTTSPSPVARAAATSFVQSLSMNERLAGSIMVELATRLYSMNNPAIIAVTSENEIDFDRFIEHPTAIFLSIPASQAQRLKWLSSTFIMQLMKHLTKKAEDTPAKRLPRPAALFLDEFGNQIIPHFPEYISLVRSAGIALLMAIQSHGQLVTAYQEEGKNTILANATTHVIFPGCGLPETTYYSERTGEKTVATTSKSSDGGMALTVTHGQARRMLLTSDEIRRMPERQVLIITDNMAPLIVQNIPYFALEKIKPRAALPYQLPQRVPRQPLPPQQPTQPLVGPSTQNNNIFLP